MRKCTVPGCGQKHRARGYCSTCYNRHVTDPAKRHLKVAVACATCGETCHKEVGRDRKYRVMFCSLKCRDAWDDTAGSVPIPPDHPARWIGSTSPVEYRSCPFCLGVITRRSRYGRHARSCPTCGKWAQNWKPAAGRLSIFERDGWMCWLCGGPIDPEARWPDLLCATLDHVIPVAHDGGDEDENLGAAHLVCNSTRKDSLTMITLPVPPGVHLQAAA